MFNDYYRHIGFGQYKDLTIKEIYQGTLGLNKDLLTKYLNEILNTPNQYFEIFPEGEFIEKFDVSDGFIKTIGDIHDPEKALSPSNRIVLGNIQSSLTNFINQHFNDNFLGILQDIRTFNKNQNKPLQIGADPEYIVWCERNVEGFQLSRECKRKLEVLPIARFKSIHVMYVGNETYEYTPHFIVESFKFNAHS
ncbi:hypothetical protein N8927_03815 [Crocinitomicaceae bacterium]|nr:hypothetical protein [Crocinitomicaceae bacterium]